MESMSMNNFPRVFLNSKEEKEIQQGFPWAFDNEISHIKHRADEKSEWKNESENEPRVSFDRKERIDKTKWRAAYQFSPVGINVGAGPLRFVAEVGYGCLGVCNIGLAVCF